MSSLGVLKSKADVRSPHTARCQGLILSTVMPKRCSRKRPIEVWSKASEHTQPPRLQGEITYMGTRGPRPHGRVVPLMVSSAFRYLRAGSEKYSPSSATVDLPIRLPSASYDGTAGGGDRKSTRLNSSH